MQPFQAQKCMNCTDFIRISRVKFFDFEKQYSEYLNNSTEFELLGKNELKPKVVELCNRKYTLIAKFTHDNLSATYYLLI